MELVPLGSMLRYLLESPNLVSPTYELIIWASQIARGTSLSLLSLFFYIFSPGFITRLIHFSEVAIF